ncbi:MAG: glucose 1-dehydrogenase [Acidiferrobacter sp.]
MISIDLSGKRALVTGSSSGLGAAMALMLAKAGAHVAIHYRHEVESAQRIVQQIVAIGGRAQAFGADVGDSDAVAKLFTQVDEALGGLDILINNAGMDGAHELCVASDPKRWERIVAVDLLGPYYCAREALMRMEGQKKGVILNITSVHEFIPWEGYSAYTAAKAGLSMMSKTVAQEAAEHNIRVLALAPGAIRTPINASVWQDPTALLDLDEKIAMGRLGEPDEIAQVATFLVSDLASYMTGTTVSVDGGMLIYPNFRHGG